MAITAPAANASFGGPVSVTLSAAAADADGTVSKVDFYNGAVLVGSATVAPYSVNWADVAVGNYSVTARATDDKGGVSTSVAVAMSVKANLAPVVSITSPADSASLAAPAALTVTANARDADGSVSKVEFYSGATLIGTATMAPYAIALNNVGAGAYVITAKATDNLGLATHSAAVRVTVTGNATQVYFIHTDQIDTPRLITNAAGQAVWQMDLEPFGANLPDENPAGLGTFAYNQRFPGQYFDRETGLHYNYYRDYDPQTGRYVQSDPIGLNGGINTYSYVGGNQLSGVDPLGLLTVYIWRYRNLKNVGHASATTANGTHISWWPDGAGRIIGSTPARAMPSLADDIVAEGRDPDEVIEIPGLDEAAIETWWKKYKRKTYYWNLTGPSCSSTAAGAMTAGGAAGAAWANGYMPGNVVWSPNDVADYANAAAGRDVGRQAPAGTGK